MTDTFSIEQLRCLAFATLPERSPHLIDYRVSVPFFGKRFYLTLLFGRERRSMARLAAEQQIVARRIAMAYGALAFILALFLTLTTIFGAYILKSSAGIDLNEGPSIFHDLLIGDSSSKN